MKIISWFSAGVTSAVATKLAITRNPDAEIEILYIPIASAHPDNDRFIADCEKWFGLPIRRISGKYTDQFDVIKQRRFINGPGGAACSYHLKKTVRFDFEGQNDFDAQVFGFEFELKEINRALRLQQQYPDAKATFPLIDAQLTKAQSADLLLKNGIALPAMYQLGYSNNNCIGCVKGGMAYWNKIRQDFPETFLRMATAEREIGRSCINGTFLDELDPQAGRDAAPVVPDCGLLCEVEFADIIDPKARQIYSDKKQLSLF